jgi:hypothetical protein
MSEGTFTPLIALQKGRQPVIDHAITTMISRKQLDGSSLNTTDRHLSLPARQNTYSAITKRLAASAVHHNAIQPIRNILENQIHSAVRYAFRIILPFHPKVALNVLDSVI